LENVRHGGADSCLLIGAAEIAAALLVQMRVSGGTKGGQA
jgi:hypothetical protein